ncbi:MAG TPA: hypothetical protein VNZ64_06375 [Candidatus Acidoferrum sp.]|jgi:hypothetical protein|nr:hypothetical protein [Candidatus Acidoferrum sp.]
MSKRVLQTACLVLVGGAIAIGLLRWWSGSNNDSADVTDQDLLKAGLKLHRQAPAQQATLPPLDLARPVRLAVGSLGLSEENRDQALGDLVTAQLSGSPGLELVERQSLEAVLQELNMSFAGLVRARDAVAVGKLLRADWFLLGTEVKLGSTNSIVLRLVDARTGVLRDAGVVRAADSLPQVASSIAGFVTQSRQAAATATPRVYLAIGAFEDLSLNNRLAGFPTQLRGSLIAAYQNSKVILLEREYVDTLLREVRLDLAGLTAQAANASPPMQSAFWLVTGQYRSYETTNLQVELLLDIRRMFGTNEHLKLGAMPADLVSGDVRKAIDQVVNRSSAIIAPTRVSEARAQMAMGRELEDRLIRGREFGLIFNDFGSTLQEAEALQRTDASVIKRKRNLEEAIRAFETVLLLDPGSREAEIYLAACLRDPVIHRLDEARNYYREIIENAVQDQWSAIAQKALVASFDRHAPAEAAKWFESAAGHTANSGVADFYRRQAEAAQGTGAIERGGDLKAEQLAERRLFEGIQAFKDYDLLEKPATNSVFGDSYGYRMGMFDYAKAFGTDRDTAAQRLASLLPKMRSQAPELDPYLLATVVSFQIDTNAPVIGEFERALALCIEHPERVFKTRKFWEYIRWSVGDWCFENTNYGLAVKVMEGERRAAGEGHVEFNDQEKLKLAYAYLGTRRWQEALEVFETFSNQPIKAPASDGPWGRAWTMVRTDKMAAYSRDKLGIGLAHDPRQFEMGPNCVCMHTSSTFAVDEEGLWLAIAGRLIRLDIDLKTNLSQSLPVGADIPITCVCVSHEKVWLGTGGAGLLEYDKANHFCRRLTEADGLLMDYLSGLCESEDALWIGYGGATGGGLGRLDLRSRKLTSFMTSLIASRDQSPPQGPVTGITRCDNGDLFMYAAATVRQLHISHSSWDTAPRKSGELLYCFAADQARLVEGVEIVQTDVEIEDQTNSGLGTNQNRRTKLVLSQDELSRLQADIKTNAGGRRITGISIGTAKPKAAVEIHRFSDARWQTIVDSDAMPNVPRALTLKGDELWAGGEGFIARLDLRQNKVRNFCRISADSVVGIQIGGGYVWAEYDRHLHRVPISSLP